MHTVRGEVLELHPRALRLFSELILCCGDLLLEIRERLRLHNSKHIHLTLSKLRQEEETRLPLLSSFGIQAELRV
jgi:hypothetical protein